MPEAPGLQGQDHCLLCQLGAGETTLSLPKVGAGLVKSQAKGRGLLWSGRRAQPHTHAALLGKGPGSPLCPARCAELGAGVAPWGFQLLCSGDLRIPQQRHFLYRVFLGFTRLNKEILEAGGCRPSPTRRSRPGQLFGPQQTDCHWDTLPVATANRGWA